MDAKQTARELVGEAVRTLAEEGAKGSIPGPVIGWLIKKGEIDAPKKQRSRLRKPRKRAKLKGVAAERVRKARRRAYAKQHREILKDRKNGVKPKPERDNGQFIPGEKYR